jgi:putative (di)nucleoside polyphosphate hydrolase
MKLRSNVAAILMNADGLMLVGERADVPGSWQFPQGGVNEGETLEEALVRELMEEVSLGPDKYLIESRRGPYNYLFGAGRKKKGYDGQSQHYFLVRFTGTNADICVETEHPEFRAARWIVPGAYELGWVPPFKRAVYQAVLRDFFGITM